MKKIISVLLLVGLLPVVLFGCGGSTSGNGLKVGTVSQSESESVSKTEELSSDKLEEETSEQSSASEVSSEASVPEKEKYVVGDILMDGDMKIVYISSGEYVEENQFMQPKDGYRYVFLRFSFENTSEKEDDSISIYSFECYADGYNVDMHYGGDDALSGTLSAGRMTTGTIIFEVPDEAEEIEVEYQPNVFLDRKIHFLYEGEKDSGYTPPKDTKPTEGAFAPGDIVETSTLRITYISSETYISDNQFIQPKDGFHYISCKFEFENIGNSDENVSSFSFDCYADGAVCEQTYSSDDDLSAELSPGRKAKGSVTFEVPNNAETIEVEYNANVWTSDRIVFTVVE